MSDGTYIAYFENSGNRFLTTLDPALHAGQYRTTDADACLFRLNSDGSITW